MSYGRRRRARFATLASGCVIIVLGLVVLLTPTVGAATTATLNPGQVGTVGTDVAHNCGQGPGWIFVLPDSQGDAFVSLSATFQTAGTVPGTVLANDKFASVNVPLTDKLLGATAQILGGTEDSTFNLSHVCEGEDGSTTTTTTEPETTTTVEETTTTAPETTTTLEATTTTAPETTTTAAETSTTVGSTSTSESTSTTTTESTTTSTSTSTSTTTTAPATTTTSFAVEGTTIVSSSTTTVETVVTAGSTLPSPSSSAAGTVTGAATGTTLPRTGNSQGVPVFGLVVLALGAGLLVGSHRRFWRS